MAKIITVTANTAVDFIIDVDGLKEKDNLEARRCRQFACGKGINVAKAIEALGLPVICLGFAGRQSQSEFQALDSDLLRTDLIAVDGRTRTNLTFRDGYEGKETHIRTPGYHVTEANCRQLVKKLDDFVKTGDIVVFSGSLPPGAPVDWYQTLIDQCHDRGAISLLDSCGDFLLAGLKAKPFIVKPNHKELEELIGHRLPNIRMLAESARSLLIDNHQWMLVSQGKEGCVAVNRKTAIYLRITDIPHRVITQIGCGDAMLAGLAAALLEGMEWSGALSQSIACGTANLFSIEPGRLKRADLADLLTRVEQEQWALG